jgi:hypothetical protein
LGLVLVAIALVWRASVPTGSVGSGAGSIRSAAAATSPPPDSIPTLSPDELEQRQREVEAVVAAKNVEAAKQRKAFEDDGWTLVDAAPPDEALASASPELLATRERELRAQLLTAPPEKEHLGNVAFIATRAREPATRIAAVEAIARMGAGDPQRALVDIMKKLSPSDAARRALVPILLPMSTADPFAREMAGLLDAPGLMPAEREQIAMTLSLVALREGTSLPRDIVEAMSPASRTLLERMTQLAQRSPQPREGSPR